MSTSEPLAAPPLHLEFEDGGTTVELIVHPLTVWNGMTPDKRPMWYLYVYDLTGKVYLDLPFERILRWWMPKTAEQMQLSGTAIISLGKLLR